MGKIIQLDRHIADLIAAGEVVERPASVAKELLENAIDAGAKMITVEVKDGGTTLIRVADDGCGMNPEDAEKAFLRHATSKLKDASGLDAIGTLGFRGEALAAIAAVSRIDMKTRERGADNGVSVKLEAGIVTESMPAGVPEGTAVTVRDLFFNTPARQKYMKSDRVESSAISVTVIKTALSRPDISIRLIRDGKTEYHTPGDSRADSCIYSLLGRDFALGLLPAETSDGSVSVSGYVSAPAIARGNRSYQFFFVNGRPIQSVMLRAALERAYANALPSGRYPSCVLYIDINAADVDVNVHPAKTTVRFSGEKQVFDGVYYAALGALSSRSDRESARTDAGAPNPFQTAQNPVVKMYDEPAEDTYRQKSIQTDPLKTVPRFDEYRSGKSGGRTDTLKMPPAQLSVFDSAAAQPARFSQSVQLAQSGGGAASIARSRPPEFRIIGEAFETYIVVEYGGGVWFIDKHAAHERIHFNALKGADFDPLPQILMSPIICKMGHEDAAVLLQNAELLEKLGFSVDDFGNGTVAVRQMPGDLDISDAEPVLSEICEELRNCASPQSVNRDKIFRTMACKTALKAGKLSDIRELEALAARVLSGEVSECPHGRPVAFEMSKTALDRSFKRI